MVHIEKASTRVREITTSINICKINPNSHKNIYQNNITARKTHSMLHSVCLYVSACVRGTQPLLVLNHTCFKRESPIVTEMSNSICVYHSLLSKHHICSLLNMQPYHKICLQHKKKKLFATYFRRWYVANFRCNMLNNHIHANTHSPRRSPGQTVFAVSSVVQLVVDHCTHCKRPCVTTKECHFTTIQDPHGPLHIVQCPLQVRVIMGHPVQLEVQQGNTYSADSRPGISHRVDLTHVIGMSSWFQCPGDRPAQPV